MSRVHEGAIETVISSTTDDQKTHVWIRLRKKGESKMAFPCRTWDYFTWLSGDHDVKEFIHSLDKDLWLHHDEPPVKTYEIGVRQRRSDPTQSNIYDDFALAYESVDGTRCFGNTL